MLAEGPIWNVRKFGNSIGDGCEKSLSISHKMLELSLSVRRSMRRYSRFGEDCSIEIRQGGGHFSALASSPVSFEQCVIVSAYTKADMQARTLVKSKTSHKSSASTLIYLRFLNPNSWPKQYEECQNTSQKR